MSTLQQFAFFSPLDSPTHLKGEQNQFKFNQKEKSALDQDTRLFYSQREWSNNISVTQIVLWFPSHCCFVYPWFMACSGSRWVMDPQPTWLSLYHQLYVILKGWRAHPDPQHGCSATVGRAEKNWTLPGSQMQVCLSHWSEQRLWAGHGDETQGFPTLQPVSTLTVLVGRGSGGASGRTPNRTPCQQKQRSALTLTLILTSYTFILCPSHTSIWVKAARLTCMHPRIPFWTSPDPSTPPTCRCFTFRPWISFPTITVPYRRGGTDENRDEHYHWQLHWLTSFQHRADKSACSFISCKYDCCVFFFCLITNHQIS